MRLPKPVTEKYDDFFTEISKGRVKIPLFQRDFVWTKAQTAGLIDSILKGYPIGTFILWKTNQKLKSIRNIGNCRLPDTPEGDMILYVLDGQQRITSLYAVKIGAVVDKEGETIDYNDIWIDLEADPAKSDELILLERPEKGVTISVYDLLNNGAGYFAKHFAHGYLDRIDAYQRQLKSYDFSTIQLIDAPIDVACEVFTRINTTGKPLSIFDIMVAKTYEDKTAENEGFDLRERFETLVDSKGICKDLEDSDFDTLPPSTVLQCVAAHLKGQVKRQDILGLDKKEFISNWNTVTGGLFAAVDYIRTHLRVPVSQLLPYDAILVPFTYFFIKKGNVAPSDYHDRELTKYFFWAGLTSRYSSGVEGKLALDIAKMDAILKENQPEYEGIPLEITVDWLKSRSFSAGDSVSKSVLCILSYFEPKSFKTGGIVKIDNSWLKTYNAKNYHHFFPRAYLTKNGVDRDLANCILNITIVDDYLNKREIKAKSPSEYMKKFVKSNHQLAKTMNTHLIDDLDEFGVWTDDYDTFLTKRGERVAYEMNSRLKPSVESSK